MTEITSETLQCPVCHGAGCDECKGIGAAERIGGRWIYWERKISAASIAEQGAERAARGLVAILLMTFGVVGITLFASIIQQQGISADAPWEIFSAARGDGRFIVFALSLLTDAFLLYRIISAQERIGKVHKRSYGDAADASALNRLADISTLVKDQRVNLGNTLSAEALRALEEAWQLGERFQAKTFAPVFLFASLLSFSKVIAIRARLGLDAKKLHALTERGLNTFLNEEPSQPVMGVELRTVLLDAYRRAYERRAPHVDVTDLFAAVSTADPLTRDLLDEMEVTHDVVENVVAWITIQEDLRRQWQYFRARARFKPKGNMNRAMTAIATPLLDRLSSDLTALAKNGFLYPCIARDKEMEGILRVMEGGHNVLLVGNPGVGKSTIIEGLAQRMVTEDVPELLQDKRLVSLSIAALVGSGSAQGDVEERLNIILNEVIRAGNIILVLENIQNLVGVNSGGGATLDLSEIMSSALANKHLTAIATTNPLDYRRYIETSSGLNSAFSPVTIEEVESNAAIKILEAKAASIEYEHHVYFSYAAIEKLVTLAKRYLHDRYLPEKAIGLMQEAAVAVQKTRGARAVVVAEDVARIVAEKTNISVTTVTEEESTKLLHLEERMHERIIGQNEAVDAVASALRRARVELRDAARPIANFLFLGPTGVGKTELAKTVAEVYFGGEENMIRLDMSEYQEQESINRLIGAPPGYRGAAEGGFLTDAVRKHPFALVLLDELEKAHPDILNLFLQVMDDGRLTDSSGRTVDFTNVILIATSNAGSDVIQEGQRAGETIDHIKERLLEHELGKYFRPEFLNRFDQIVVFRPLSKSEIISVTTLMMRQLAKRLEAKGISFEASDAAIRELADAGFDPLFGARPLRRLIQERVDNALAKYLLTGKISRRDRAVLEVGGAIRVEEAPSIWKDR